ncbi:hypothetical protein GCM10012284_17130 [Mangrovihabitans endophyticus]|uniref:Uncharacterized protein n=1 Tax=Mangrovihabitans endophyticus TaxID=1751298 RepID=A0A8J3BYG9_9ACTN|nr:hypothetical protein GCM10012284_17130 [Mangrovihabitans endophyticus]
MEGVTPVVEIGDHRFTRPVSITIDDVAPIPMRKKFRVVLLAEGPLAGPRSDTDFFRHHGGTRYAAGCGNGCKADGCKADGCKADGCKADGQWRVVQRRVAAVRERSADAMSGGALPGTRRPRSVREEFALPLVFM